MTETVAERYVRLGLRLDRLVEGTVDSYVGPPELAAEVAAEKLPEAHELVDQADALLAELPESWLRDQVTGLRTSAGMLAGESRSYTDEVHGYYGVRPTMTDEAVFAEAHENLDALLPGTGSLAERQEQWHRSMWVPADRVEGAVVAILAEARARTGQLVDLPPGEGVDLEFVRDVPWNGYNSYLGGLRGKVEINVSRPMTAYHLLHLVLHETYPGHQAERVCKEVALVRGQGRLEETIVLEPTPQSLIAEGIGEIAPETLLRGAAGDAFARIMRDTGVDFDLDRSATLARAAEACGWSSVNASLMLHEQGAGEAEVTEYLRRWWLVTAEEAGRAIRFMTAPETRTYGFNYPAGKRLCRAYAATVPDGFRRLLTEQVRVGDLLGASV
ncbi:hypothetical protein AB0M43_22545 [Longispora sp. NPDC051575]|uniref:hypothetical protein n=1 Tax=Longispora sp. NPDC051575 TaxID=3154943 RepID=UPI003415A115